MQAHRPRRVVVDDLSAGPPWHVPDKVQRVGHRLEGHRHGVPVGVHRLPAAPRAGGVGAGVAGAVVALQGGCKEGVRVTAGFD